MDEVWRRLLASDEAQQLVERIAEAPEVRAAVAAQGVGLVSDIGRQVARFAHRFDRRSSASPGGSSPGRRAREPSANAGLLSRALAVGLDVLILNLSFSAVAAIVALVVSAFNGNANGASDQALVLGASSGSRLAASTCWSSGRLRARRRGCASCGSDSTPTGSRRLRLGQAVRRLIGLGLSVLTFGIGFLGILFNQRRRGWEDRLSDSEVLYIEPTVNPAPWATLGAGPAGASRGAPRRRPGALQHGRCAPRRADRYRPATRHLGGLAGGYQLVGGEHRSQHYPHLEQGEVGAYAAPAATPNGIQV